MSNLNFAVVDPRIKIVYGADPGNQEFFVATDRFVKVSVIRLALQCETFLSGQLEDGQLAGKLSMSLTWLGRYQFAVLFGGPFSSRQVNVLTNRTDNTPHYRGTQWPIFLN